MTHKHTPYFNLLEAIRQPGCPLCRLGAQAALRFIEGLLYESVTDYKMRQILINAHGLCPTHSETLVAQHDSLGTAILYTSVLKHLQEELDELLEKGEGRFRVTWGRQSQAETILVAHAPCPACEQRDAAARRALSTFGENYTDLDLTAALEESSGLCLLHLRQAVIELNGASLTVVLNWHKVAWQLLRAEMDELVRKHDFRFRDEKISEQQKEAWIRAVRTVIGEQGVF